MKIPDSHTDLLGNKRAFGNLATLTSSGAPQVTPVWVDFDGTHILVNSAKGRLKDKNMRARPTVALSIQDPENPYRYLGIQGRVEQFVEGPPAEEHIDKMAKKYMGQDKYPMRAPGEQRVLYKIAPLKVHAIG